MMVRTLARHRLQMHPYYSLTFPERIFFKPNSRAATENRGRTHSTDFSQSDRILRDAEGAKWRLLLGGGSDMSGNMPMIKGSTYYTHI